MQLFTLSRSSSHVSNFLHCQQNPCKRIANRVIQQLQGKTHNVEQPKSDDGFVFQEEAAKLLKVSLRTLIRWDKSGYLPKRHVGRRVAYRREDINRLAGTGQRHD